MTRPKAMHLTCSCSYLDHQVVITHWPDDFDAIYVNVRLTPDRPWWTRARTAARHLFGGPACGFGDWGEVILDDPDEIRELIVLLQSFIDSRLATRVPGERT